MVLKTEYKNIESYTTKDGSIIRELFHPDHRGNKNQSPAEATEIRDRNIFTNVP